jgi:Zn finger protein HypA/HybF involved in hydrogenase expression
MRDVLKELWCCLTCSTVMEAGKLRTQRDSPFFHCPHCGSGDTHAADGAVRNLKAYHGEVGTLN